VPDKPQRTSIDWAYAILATATQRRAEKSERSATPAGPSSPEPRAGSPSESLLQSEVTFCAALVLDAERFVVSFAFDGTDRDDEHHAGLFIYDGRYARPWTYHDSKQALISSLATHCEVPDGPRALCALSDLDGDVTYYSLLGERLVIEDIADAGLSNPIPMSKKYGHALSIRQIGSHLYVSGMRGQVYRRSGPGRWVHMDKGLLQENDKEASSFLHAINGPAEDDIYVAGSIFAADAHRGAVFHWNGRRWRRIETPPVSWITAIHVESEDRIWLAGNNGALLVGNHRSGFQSPLSKYAPAHPIRMGNGWRACDLRPVSDLFHALTIFEGTLYIGTNQGLYQFDETIGRVIPVQTGLARQLTYVSTLGQADGVIWCFGPKDIACFDGVIWTRIHHPYNPDTDD
jgi:hypothetical protein